MRLILQYLAWPCSPIGAAWRVGCNTTRMYPALCSTSQVPPRPGTNRRLLSYPGRRDIVIPQNGSSKSSEEGPPQGHICAVVAGAGGQWSVKAAATMETDARLTATYQSGLFES